MSQIQPKVSVIIPVYKAEPYIEKCVRSLFGQTLDSLQYIFIDDCSPDNSIRVVERVLKEYPDRKSQVIILKNEINRGVGQTRQRGIDASTGEYIIHCDPDDWVDNEMYESLYNRAKEANADIVMCDYFEEYKDKNVLTFQNVAKYKKQLFKQISNNEIHCSFWNKLIKSTLSKKYRIDTGINMCEDLSIVSCLLIEAETIEKVDKGFYHYRMEHLASITKSDPVSNSISSIKAVESMIRRFSENGLVDSIDPIDLYKSQWNAKRSLLSEPTKANIDLWLKAFPQSNEYYMDMMLSSKDRALTYLALHKCYRILALLKIINNKFRDFY